MTKEFDLGSAIIFEVQFKKLEPYGDTYTLFNPTSPQISVWDSAGVIKVNAQSLLLKDTGRYYYIMQSTEEWTPGTYDVKVSGTDGTYSDVFADWASIYLKKLPGS